jgi:Relaxase/Mobilisation nuclease domain
MFARVNYNRSIRHTLNYNERKMKLGKAECLLAENFLKDPQLLSRDDKLSRFTRLNVLNDKAKANTLHISLNFHPTDQIDNELMKELARKYMEKLHLDRQPWLAYRHHDAGHPHIHIVSTLIQPNGNRLKLDDILEYKSLKATMEIERQYSLVHFYRLEELPRKRLHDSPPKKLVYGEPMRKEAVERLVDHVINEYRFTSLAEYNAILRLYSVKAKVVWENQALNKPKGLMYYTLDEKGHLVGLSFKSSSFPTRPTLKKLEQRFLLNQSLWQEQLKRLTLSIDWAFAGRNMEWEEFRKNLLKEKIHVVLEKDKGGEWQNIYYVDVGARCAYDGETIGGRYSCQEIRKRCLNEEQMELKQSLKLNDQHK